MMRSVVFVADDYAAFAYYRPFQDFGEMVKNHHILWDHPEMVNMVLFTGGADINSNIYNDKPSSRTFTHPPRDVHEYALYARAKQMKLPMVGVCRGAQFLCAMAGGKLYQHVENHDSSHECITKEGDSFVISSSHHQMMRPPKSSVLLAWAHPRRSNIYIGADDRAMPLPSFEPEACFFPNINAVGMQYHPEAMRSESEGFKYAARIVQQYLGISTVERKSFFDDDNDDDNTELEKIKAM